MKTKKPVSCFEKKIVLYLTKKCPNQFNLEINFRITNCLQNKGIYFVEVLASKK
jgi:hypothetical protein